MRSQNEECMRVRKGSSGFGWGYEAVNTYSPIAIYAQRPPSLDSHLEAPQAPFSSHIDRYQRSVRGRMKLMQQILWKN